MPPPMPAGEVFTDSFKKNWVIGGSVGKGGFGEIYLAAESRQKANDKDAQYVIKVVSMCKYLLKYSVEVYEYACFILRSRMRMVRSFLSCRSIEG